jgi:hypothetical protein
MMGGLDMAQEDKNVTIPPEMMQEIVRVASETAIEKFQHEAERNRKAVKDKRLHNTKLLLQNYHCFVEHSKSAVYEASQLSEDDDFEELMEELMSQTDGRVRVPVVRSIQESAAHTRIIVQHIDRMLEYYKFRCEHSKRAEEMRRYRTIYSLYIADEPKNQQQIADEEQVDLSTVFRDQKAGISKLSALIFPMKSFVYSLYQSSSFSRSGRPMYDCYILSMKYFIHSFLLRSI